MAIFAFLSSREYPRTAQKSRTTMQTSPYREAKRIHTSVLAAVEKRCLVWMAQRLPQAINSDHLTVLAGLAMVGAGACYWIGPASPGPMLGAIGFLILNWFGDSLDG